MAAWGLEGRNREGSSTLFSKVPDLRAVSEWDMGTWSLLGRPQVRVGQETDTLDLMTLSTHHSDRPGGEWGCVRGRAFRAGGEFSHCGDPRVTGLSRQEE